MPGKRPALFSRNTIQLAGIDTHFTRAVPGWRAPVGRDAARVSIEEEVVKILLGFKTPDVLDDAIVEAISCEATQPDDFERAALEEELKQACRKFVKHGEYCTIEIDTETGTAEVIPV